MPLRGAQAVTKPARARASNRCHSDRTKRPGRCFSVGARQSSNPYQEFRGFSRPLSQILRREAVLRTICTYAQQANAPDVIVQYGQMLLETTPNDPRLLTLLIDALGRQNDRASRTRAIEYASRLIAIAEGRDQAGLGREQQAVRRQERIAGIYARRAGFYRDSDDADKAVADYEKATRFIPRPSSLSNWEMPR